MVTARGQASLPDSLCRPHGTEDRGVSRRGMSPLCPLWTPSCGIVDTVHDSRDEFLVGFRHSSVTGVAQEPPRLRGQKPPAVPPAPNPHLRWRASVLWGRGVNGTRFSRSTRFLRGPCVVAAVRAPAPAPSQGCGVPAAWMTSVGALPRERCCCDRLWAGTCLLGARLPGGRLDTGWPRALFFEGLHALPRGPHPCPPCGRGQGSGFSTSWTTVDRPRGRGVCPTAASRRVSPTAGAPERPSWACGACGPSSVQTRCRRFRGMTCLSVAGAQPVRTRSRHDSPLPDTGFADLLPLYGAVLSLS